MLVTKSNSSSSSSTSNNVSKTLRRARQVHDVALVSARASLSNGHIFEFECLLCTYTFEIRTRWVHRIDRVTYSPHTQQTGRLNMSNRGLEEFPIEITEMEKHLEKDEKFWECESLSRIDLGHNRITVLPISISSVRYLRTLKIHTRTHTHTHNSSKIH